ncbi:MAG TPA: tetratricopeptide repeat protein [Polaromonas sp.]|uniref:nuclear transport factor 2 family protein n=1 Tax=Polaromonas sp. TaxID=1869339 RepID=UPI002D6FFB3F|nr:tetratricopeptide repeat protein [Polaromonas sp.]HYW55716.1 tetratricopeptide repeat protein [Polaromonas sp.]
MPQTVPFSSKPLTCVLRWLVLTAALFVTAAHADEYTDVNDLARAGKLPEALAKAEQYLAGKPRDPQMRFIKGVIQTEAGKPGDAITTFTKITQDYPELPEPYNNLAVLYASQNQFDKARASLEMAIRTNPSYATAHENLGDVYARLASQAYSKALQLDGNNAAVPPKLALIRTLFSAESTVPKRTPGNQSSGPVTTQPPPAAVAPAPAPTPAPARPAVVVPPAAAPAPAVTPTPTPTPADATSTSAAEKEIERALRAWATAWSSKDVPAYLSAYGKDFSPPGNQSRKAWEEDRRSRIVGKSRISVKLSNVSVAVKGSKATAKFKQDYSADALNVSSRKTLDMAKAGDRWLIVRESTGS